jgi:hypothetical protein
MLLLTARSSIKIGGIGWLYVFLYTLVEYIL